MKKIVRILMVAVMFFSALLGVGAKEAAENTGGLEVNTVVGFNDVYKIGYPTPINVNIKNNFKDINGEVEIRVPSSPGKYMSYVKPVSLQKGAEKTITINVPIGNDNRTKYAVNIYDGGDRIFDDTITTVASNNITTFIGILSDDFNSLSYINSVPASAGVSLITKNIKLDEKNFPEDIFTLNTFNILVINDFDTSRFSKSQYEILKQWVRNGGTLIIGTGSKYNKTLSIFKDDFIEGSQGSVQEISTSKIYELATNGDNKNEAKVEVLTLKIKDSTVVMEDQNISLVQARNKGKGVVGILAFDLGKAPFANWNNNTAFMEKVLELVNPGLAGTNANNNNNMNSFRNNTYALQDAVNQFSEMAAPKTASFYLILFIYVLVVAPISYIVLKKLDKREWMWLTVPVLAIIFGAVVYVTGSGTRLSQITTNFVSYISLDKNGNASTDTYAGILNTYKSRVKVSGQNGERLLPVNNNFYTDQTFEKEVLEATIFAGENGRIEYKNSSLLETKILQIQENTLDIGKVETNLRLRDGKITGTVKNSTGLDLTDCLLVMPDGYYKIDSLKSGAAVNLDTITQGKHQGNFHIMIGEVFFNRSNSNANAAVGTDKKRNLDLRQEGNILQRMFDYGNGQINGINFIAFSKTQIHKPLLVNGTPAKKNERNILLMPVDVKFTDEGKVEYPLGFIPFEVMNTSNLNYDIGSSRFYGSGSAELIYKLDKDMLVEEFEVNTSKMPFKSFSSGYSIYNIRKETYEPLIDIVIKGESVQDYLTPENTVKIKLEVTDGDIGAPQMAAKGRDK